MVVGVDFCFGKGCKGIVEDLVVLGEEFGFGVIIVLFVMGGD